MNTQAVDLAPPAAHGTYRLAVGSTAPLEPLFLASLSSLGTLRPDPNASPSKDYDLLVLDARALPAPAFGAHAKKARATLEHERAVLVLRPTSAHKKALAEHGALHHYADGDSLALLIEPRRDPAGALRTGLAEQRYTVTSGTARRISVDDQGTVTADESKDVAATPVEQTAADLAPFFARVSAVVARLSAGATIPLDDDVGGFGQPNLPPPSIPSALWYSTPIAIYQPMSFTSPFNPLPTGNALWQALVTVGTYYDNTSFSTPVQWAFVEQSGSLSLPYNSKTQNGLIEQNNDNEGWSIGMYSVLGNDISGPGLVSNQSSPQNANNTVSYTSSSSFQVGLSAGTDGLSGNATYEIGSSVTNNLTEWAVQKTGPDSWVFSQQVPYSGTNTTSFPNSAAGHRGAPVAVPAISAGDFDFCTQTVWINTPANLTSVDNTYTYQMNLFWYHVDSRHPIRWSATMNYWQVFIGLAFVINFGLAYPSG